MLHAVECALDWGRDREDATWFRPLTDVYDALPEAPDDQPRRVVDNLGEALVKFGDSMIAEATANKLRRERASTTDLGGPALDGLPDGAPFGDVARRGSLPLQASGDRHTSRRAEAPESPALSSGEAPASTGSREGVGPVRGGGTTPQTAAFTSTGGTTPEEARSARNACAACGRPT